MSGSEGHSSNKQGKGLSLPGQSTEEAVAEVGSEAGKSLVRGFGKLSNAYFSEWTAKREARAEAARIAIETDAKIKTDAALATARRDQEAAELEHRGALERRAARLRVELAREQINLEVIERRALEFTEGDANNGNSREIDEDWLFKFADLAQKVSDSDVQSLWARALSSAAMEGMGKLSAAALQTLGLFDKDIAENFKKFVAVVVRLRFFPHRPDGTAEPQQIDLATLIDLGLIREGFHNNEPYDLVDFVFKEDHGGLLGLKTYLELTKRGREIAAAVFRNYQDLPLNEEDEQRYLQFVLQEQLRQGRATILPKSDDSDPAMAVHLTKRTALTENAEKVYWKFSEKAQALSPRLSKLLEWAEKDNDIEIK
jgi:hypothetical protein